MTAPTHRLLVEQDQDADGPIAWGRLVSIRISDHFYGWRDSTPQSKEDPLDLTRVLSRQSQVLPDRDRAIEATIRWARVFHGVEVQRWEPRGYVQSAWGDALAYLADANERAEPLADQARILTGVLEVADAWYRGDVYVVTLQQRVTWVRDGANRFETGDTMSTWEDVDSLGGCYLDDEYTANDVARGYFDLPAKGEPDLLVVESTDY